MEAIAALGLACNVIQVVNSAVDAAKLIQQIYKDGAIQAHVNLSDNSKALKSTTESLRQSLSSTRTGISPSDLDTQLVQIATDCTDVSTKLCAELEKFESKGGRRDALLKSMRAWRKKGDIEKLRTKLETHERTLNTGLLVSLRQQHDAANAMRSDEFRSLGGQLQQFIQDIAAGISTCSDLVRREHLETRRVIRQSQVQTTNHIDSVMTNLQLGADTAASRTQLLNSLRFADMNARMNQIAKSEENTFEWIFHESIESPWSNLSQWLATGEDVYWIQGKAGSGKSTLVKFILEHKRTHELLRSWAEPYNIQLLKFGFWLSGSPQQRSMQGLLCSLLYQLISNHKHLANILLQTHPTFSDKKTPFDWSEAELANTLHDTLSIHLTSYVTCVFLDGLDELDGREKPSELWNWIKGLLTEKAVKFCVSSRPEHFWFQCLSQDPMLRLQDLTRSDIRIYTESQLKPLTDVDASVKGEKTTYENLIDEVVYKADGVFLWARLVVNALLRGFRAQATLEELRARVYQLPSDIERLYEDMFARIGDDWQLVRDEATFYLYLCSLMQPERNFHPTSAGVLVTGPTMLDLWACELSRRQGWHQDYANFSFNDVHVGCLRTQTRILTLCSGMLEIHEAYIPLNRKNSDDTVLLAPVTFSHRSVKDFLTDKPAGQSLLAPWLSIQVQVQCTIFKAQLWQCRHKSSGMNWSSVESLIATLFLKDVVDKGLSDIMFEHLRVLESNITDSCAHRVGTQLSTIGTAGTLDCLKERDLVCQYWLSTNMTGSWAVRNSSFDVLGMTLCLGISAYFWGWYQLAATPGNPLDHVTGAYLDYLFTCTMEGLQSLLRSNHPYAEYSNYKAHSIKKVMQQLLDAGANVQSILSTKSWLHDSFGKNVTVLFCMKHKPTDERDQDPDITEYLDSGLHPDVQGRICCPPEYLLSDFVWKGRPSGFDIFVEMDIYDYVQEMTMIPQADEKFCYDTSQAKQKRVLCIRSKKIDSQTHKYHSDAIRGYVPIDQDSDRISERVSMLVRAKRDCQFNQTRFDEEARSLLQSTEELLSEIVNSQDTRPVNTGDYLAGLGYESLAIKPPVWRERIPRYKNMSKDTDSEPYMRKDCAEQCEELSDNDSFKSFK